MSRDSFYFKHDLDARNDPKIVKLRMTLGSKGYGIYWLIIEKLYNENGRIDRDFKALGWELHESPDDIKAVVDCFEAFYDADGKIACRRVDRDLADRRDASRKASAAGKASAEQRAFNGRSTGVQPGEERRGEEQEITDKKLGGVAPRTFTPPTIEEVKAYCLERKNKVDPERWHDFYASKGWLIGKNKMKDWRAAVRTWERSETGSFQAAQAPRRVVGGAAPVPGKYDHLG